MRKTIITIAVILMVCGSASAEVSIASSPWTTIEMSESVFHGWGSISGEINLINSISVAADVGLAVSPRVIIGTSLKMRILPFNGNDLGYDGYPYNSRDFGHTGSFFFGTGLGFGYVFPTETLASVPVIRVPIELGYKWYPIRQFLALPFHFLDDIFIEAQLIVDLNISRWTQLFDYDPDANYDAAFDMVTIGLSFGNTF